MEGLVFLFLVWAVCGCLAAWIAGQRGRSGVEGFLLGFLFGPFGIIIELFLPQIRQRDSRFQSVDEWHRNH